MNINQIILLMRFNNQGYYATPRFFQHVENRQTGLYFNDGTAFAFQATTLVDESLLPSGDYVALQHSEDTPGMIRELIKNDFIEPQPYTHLSTLTDSGYITVPVHKLTPFAIKIRQASIPVLLST